MTEKNMCWTLLSAKNYGLTFRDTRPARETSAIIFFDMEGTSLIPVGFVNVDSKEFEAWVTSRDAPDFFTDGWCAVILYKVRHSKEVFAALKNDGTVVIDPKYLK